MKSYLRAIARKIPATISLAVAGVLFLSVSASALSEKQKQLMDSGIYYFNNEQINCDFIAATGGGGGTLPNSVPQVWRDLIMAAAPQYPDVDPRLVASVLWAENRGWPTYRTTGWAVSPSASAAGPWQFIPSTWANMGTDGNGDGVKDPNNPADAVHAAFKHHAGSAGKPVAVQGFNAAVTAEANLGTTVFQRNDSNLLYYAAKYNGSGAPDGVALASFPRGQNSDYVIMNFWLLASNFEQGWNPESGQIVDAKVTGQMFGAGTAGTLAPGSGSALTANPLCPGAAGASGLLVGDVAWPMDKALYDANPGTWTDPHHDYPASDIGVAQGTPVYSMLAGRVSSAPVGGGCGLGVSIDTGTNIRITYCHGTDGGEVQGARQLEQVSAGQLIMHSGNTGHSTGPHLHVQIKVNGENRCPQPLFLGMAAGSPPAIESLPNSGCTY